jgi:hypothetical protein
LANTEGSGGGGDALPKVRRSGMIEMTRPEIITYLVLKSLFHGNCVLGKTIFAIFLHEHTFRLASALAIHVGRE